LQNGVLPKQGDVLRRVFTMMTVAVCVIAGVMVLWTVAVVVGRIRDAQAQLKAKELRRKLQQTSVK